MATQNAIDTNKPIGVDDGGTGASTLTDHGVLVGSGTADITALAVGTTGQLLVGVVTADPAFGSTSSEDFTFGGSAAGSARTLTVENTSNTASSDAKVEIVTAGGSAGDPYTEYTVSGAGVFSVGVDRTDSGKFKVSASSALGTTDTFVSTSAGEITKPLQPAFLAWLGTTDSDVTGDGTTYTLGGGNALTEVYDQGGDFVTTGTFTAPVTGRYSLRMGFRLQDIGASHTQLQGYINTSNGNYAILVNAAGIDRSGTLSQGVVTECDMDASDTALAKLSVSGSTKTVDVAVAGTNRTNFFCGHLIC